METTAFTAIVRNFPALILALLTGSAIANPTITTHPSNQSVSEGRPVSFSATATGTPAPTYQWQRDNTNLPGATASTFSLAAAYASDHGAAYRVVVTNSNGSDTSDPASLTVTARVPSADSNLAAWPHSRDIYINTKASGAGIYNDVHGFPLAVRLHAGNFSFSQARKDGQDLRFSKSNGVRLPHEIEYWDAVACSAVIWVGVDTVKGNDSTQHIRMYWGKEDAELDNHWSAIYDTASGFGGAWHLSEKPNDYPRILRDRTAFGRFGTGTNFSSSGWTTAVLGKGTKFDGSNDFVSLGTNIPALSGVAAATFSSWVYLPHTNSKKMLYGLSKNSGSATNDSRFAVYMQNQKIHVEARAGDGETLQTSSTVDTAAANTWLHLAAVVDYANDSILVYINGVAKTLNGLPSFTATQASATVSSNGAFGSEDQGNGTYLEGRLDEVQLSRVKRNPDWVKLAYENEKPTSSILSFRNSYQAWSHDRDLFLRTHASGADIDGNLFDFPILVRLDSTHLPFSQVRGDAEDLRFANANGKPLSVSIQSWDSAAGTGLVWVKVDTILGNNSQQYLRMHWGQGQTIAGARQTAVFDTSLGYGGVWHLDENPGGGTDAFKDQTILANHGTTGGGMSSGDGISAKVATGIRFDGSNDYLNIGDSLTVVSKVEGATISGWLRMDSLPTTERTIVAFSINSSPAHKTPRVGLLIENKKLRVVGRSEDLVDVSTVTSLDSLEEDQWYHVTGRIDFQNDSIWIHVNGDPWATTGAVCFEDSVTNSSFSRSNKIAAYGDLTQEFLPGALDEVHISRVARPRDWLKLTYENQKSGSSFLEWENEDAVVAITSPADGYVTNQSSIAVTWTVNGVTQGSQTTETLATEGENEVVRCFAGVCDEITVIRDTQAPVVVITSPANGYLTNQGTIAVAWTVDGVARTDQLTEILEADGTHEVIRTFTDAAGNTGADTIEVTRDTQAPVVEITSPVNGYLTNQSSISIAWKVDGFTQGTENTETLELEDTNQVIRIFTDPAGNTGADTIVVIRDTQAPLVEIINPADGYITNQSTITVAWTIEGVTQGTGNSETLALEDTNLVIRSHSDAAGNTGADTIIVIRDTQAPVVEITSPANNYLTNQTSISIVWKVDEVTQGSQNTVTLPSEGSNLVIRSYTDPAGNTGADTLLVNRDTQAPVVVITFPDPVDTITTSSPVITVTYSVDGQAQPSFSYTLQPGWNTIYVDSTDAAGNTGIDSAMVLYPRPVVVITSPADSSFTSASVIRVHWTVNGVQQTFDTTSTLTSANAWNRIIRVKTAFGLEGRDTIYVFRDTKPPKITLISPKQGTIILEDSVDIRWSADSVEQSVIHHEMDTSSANFILLGKADSLGNKDSVMVTLYAGTRAPNLIGLMQPRADSVLDSMALEPYATWVDNDSVPTGEVFEQVPDANDTIQYRHRVRYSLSRGPDAVDLTLKAINSDSVQVDPNTLAASGEVQVSISNLGRGIVTDSFTVLVFEDRDRDGAYSAPNDLLLGQETMEDSLPAGDSLSASISVSGSLLFHSNRISVFVDAEDAIIEVNEGNNISNSMVACRKLPQSMDYTPILKWGWRDSTPYVNFGKVRAGPFVGQLNDDNGDSTINEKDIPDIIAATYVDNSNNHVLALDGRTGNELWKISRFTNPWTTYAVGDVDGDGTSEIVLIESQPGIEMNRILVLDNEGNEKSVGQWRFQYQTSNFEGITLHDLDGDGKVEILWGLNVHNHMGELVFPEKFDPGFRKVVPIDLDRDGYQELIGSAIPPGYFESRFTTISFKDKKIIDSNSTNSNLPDNHILGKVSGETPILMHRLNYFQNAIGHVNYLNLGLDTIPGIPDVPIDIPEFAANLEVHPADHYFYGSDTSRYFYTIGSMYSGPNPFVTSYRPYFARTNLKDSTVTYKILTQYSGGLGSGTPFDLNDDGNPEIILQSKDTLFILSPDGATLGRFPFQGDQNADVTVADVDRDNHADIIIGSPESSTGNLKLAVLSNPTWVGARSIYPSVNYMVTNINDDGTIPRFPTPHWEANNTVNIQCVEGHYACVDLSASYPQIAASSISVRVGNGGAKELPQGIPVSFYISKTSPAGAESLLTTIPLPSRLASGAYVTLQAGIPSSLRGLYTFRMVADDSGNGHGMLDESKESNNSVSLTFMLNNVAPSIVDHDHQFAEPGVLFKDTILAIDEIGDELEYELTKFPAGMEISPTTGVIEWTPSLNPPRCTVTVKVSDPYNGTDSMTYLVYVDDGTNLPPVISFTPDTTAVLNAFAAIPYITHLDTMVVTDPESEEPLELSLDCLSCGTKQGPGLNGNELSWTPVQPFWTVADSGRFRLRVTDARGATASKEWTVKLTRTFNSAPVFNLPPDSTAVEDSPWKSPVSLFDLDQDPLTIILDTIPIGMSFSNDSLRWTPTIPGSFVVRIGADDGFDTTWQRFIVVVSPVNDTPQIVSAAVNKTIPGALYQYQVHANDEDGDAITYSLTQAPSGMSISSQGLISWTPPQSQSSAVNVEVVAEDPSDAEDRQSWSLSMVPDTIPPTVHMSFSKNPARVGTSVTVTFGVGDNVDIEDSSLTRDGTPVTLTNGQYVFTPSSTGTIVFLGQAEDPSSNTGTFSATLRVTNAADLTPPGVDISYSPVDPEAGETITFTVTVTDTDGVDAGRQWVEVDGAYLPVVGGQVQYVARRPGNLTAKAIAFDSLGASALDDTSLIVSPQGGDSTPPSASISSPAEDSVVYGMIPIEGTASDANLAYYTLSYRDLNTSDWVEYHRSTTSVTADSLGVIDATSLTNGDYQIRLDVYDRAGHSNSDTLQVQIAGEKKIGNFTLAFQDLTLPMSGMELTVTRTYDSRVKTLGDFGIGWKMGMRSIALHENRNQGSDWNIQRTPGLLPNYYFSEGKPHTVTVTLPGGRKQEFVPEPQFFSPFSPTYGVMTYRAKPGTYSRLEAVEVDTFVVMGGELYDERGDFEEPFNPQMYRITLLDGSYFVYDQTSGGVIESGDANGNVMAWEQNAIRHNAGEDIDFTRDSFNRITSISDGAGRGMQYRYDVVGNLSEVLDANGNSTRFNYGPKSYLLEVIDARGVRAARTEYDEDGRLIRQINAMGDTMHLDHDLPANTEEIEDFNGRVTTYTYDAQGNVLTKTDDANNTWTYAYDSVGNVLSTSQPGGGIKSSTYDDHGNELTSTDELDHTTTREYDEGGRVLSSEDPLGRITEYEYDSRGNLEREIGPGNVVQSERSYDSRGNLLSEDNALGFVTTHTYDARGWLTSTTDPLGRVTSYAHDAAGNVIREVNPEGDTTRYGYDANGNRTFTVNAFGDTTRIEYNAINKPVRQIDARGHSTWLVYNALGDKVLDIAADSAETEREYDAAGNVSAVIDPVGRRVEMTYDHENRLKRTTFAVGQYNENTYDALGRRISTRDANGNVTEYRYDLAGRDTAVIDAAGNRTRYEYDAAGRKTAMVDAFGFRTEYAYDAYDRLTTTTFADGTTKGIGYDLAGRKTSETDPMGRTTLFEYDSVGNLTAVVDALQNRTEYTYDENNNRISQKDANNHTTSMAYDALNRMVSRTYPGGNQERWTYDAQGNMLSHVKGSDSTAYLYDAVNREIHREYFPSGHEVTTTYTLDGKRDSVTDHRGLTTFVYDSRGRLAAEGMPNGDFLEHDFDPQGNRLRVITPFDTTEYRYDALNRMDSVVARGGVTRYLYNAVGNRDSVLYPNGTSTGYSYDSLHRLTEVRNWSPVDTLLSLYSYTLNAAGIRTAVEELDSSQVAYGYDTLYRLTSEVRTGSHPYSIHYTYDDVGNRLTQVKDGDTTIYTYNSRDQLTEEDGPTGSISYGYDPAGRQTSKTTSAGTTSLIWVDGDRLDSLSGPGVAIRYTYDAEGRRVKETSGGITRQSLIDRLLPYGQVVQETDGAGNLVSAYVLGLDRISQDHAGETRYYLADGQGSIRQLTDTAGEVTDTWTYTAFGEQEARTGATPNRFTYTGEEYDPNSGFVYLRQRWMDPASGRMLSIDPFAGDQQSPISLHRYLYANASPANFSDPSGEIATRLSQWLKALKNLTGEITERAFGSIAHAKIVEHIDNSNSAWTVQGPFVSIPNPAPPNYVFADLVINRKSLYEIKPYGDEGLASDEAWWYVSLPVSQSRGYVLGTQTFKGTVKDVFPGINIDYSTTGFAGAVTYFPYPNEKAAALGLATIAAYAVSPEAQGAALRIGARAAALSTRYVISGLATARATTIALRIAF